MHPRLAQVASTSGRLLHCQEDSVEYFKRRLPNQRCSSRLSDRRNVFAASRDGAQVRAIAIPWNDGPDQAENSGSSVWGGWTFEDTEESEEVAERTAPHTSSREKPLKINRDLLLVRLNFVSREDLNHGFVPLFHASLFIIQHSLNFLIVGIVRCSTARRLPGRQRSERQHCWRS